MFLKLTFYFLRFCSCYAIVKRYNEVKHIAEKEQVRKIKKKLKEEGEKDPTVLVGSFDLQQVIHLPITKESAVFYKRRLAAFNLTFYNICTKECTCFTWHEGVSKRGSNEIATTVYKALQNYDRAGVKKVNLFCNGCSGQNKNSIIATIILYVVNTATNIESISLRYFEAFHGQNEGDTCHSTISTALSTAGNVFVPIQLLPIFSLARRSRPYIVFPLEYQEFLDFKSISKEL